MSEISLETDSAAASAAEWREYADVIEGHGQHQHVPIEELPALLGDVYADYTDAKAAEYEARTAAYQRVAEQAREHARKLGNTRQTFEQGDQDSAQRIQQAAAFGMAPEVGGRGPRSLDSRSGGGDSGMGTGPITNVGGLGGTQWERVTSPSGQRG